MSPSFLITFLYRVSQGSKEGKAAWKHRKAALDELEGALASCSGLIDSGPPQRKKLVDLCRALRDRLSDTQINLRPVAARNLGNLLLVVDKTTQAKLGKIAYGPLITGAMNDIKKPMRDACLEGLRVGTSLPELEGGGINEEALESLVSALVAEVNESSVRVSFVVVYSFVKVAISFSHIVFPHQGGRTRGGFGISGKHRSPTSESR